MYPARKYNGRLGRIVKKAAQLEALAMDRRSVAVVFNRTCIVYVTPAACLINRSYVDVARMLRYGRLRVYIKPCTACRQRPVVRTAAKCRTLLHRFFARMAKRRGRPYAG